MSESTDKITLGDIKSLGEEIKKSDQKIMTWKRIVKEFATKHGLTDREAIDVAHRIEK